MKLLKKSIYVMAMMAVAVVADAQTLHSLYFIDGNNQRHTLNPAFTSDKGFVTFPALGNLSVSANSNIGLGAVMTPRGNEMVTFMHESISSEDALKKFKESNIVEANVDLNIITVGFNAWNGTNTIGLSVRSRSGVY